MLTVIMFTSSADDPRLPYAKRVTVCSLPFLIMVVFSVDPIADSVYCRMHCITVGCSWVRHNGLVHVDVDVLIQMG